MSKAAVKRVAVKLLKWTLIVVAVLGLGVVGYVGFNVVRFNQSLAKVYDVPVRQVSASKDPAVIARGKHLSESVAPCNNEHCHGEDLGGGKTLVLGPLATVTGPNLTSGGLGLVYTDGEFFRAIRHGIKKDGRSVRFMPAQDFSWLPDSDVIAIVSYLRSVPPVERPAGPTDVGVVGKMLDRHDLAVFDVARRIPPDPKQGPPPSPTAEYGSYLARLCASCHGDGFAGGRPPGTPSEWPVPANLTPHETGLKDWKYEDFDRLLTTGIRKNGKKLAKVGENEMMPVSSFAKLDETEKRALWAFFTSLPPRELGGR